MNEPRVVIVELPFLPPAELRGNSRAHWVEKHNKSRELREAVFVRLQQAEPYEGGGMRYPLRWACSLMRKAVVFYEFYYCGPLIDKDNFIIGMKPALDELVSFGILADDNAEVVDIRAECHRVKHRDETRTTITVTEVLNAKD